MSWNAETIGGPSWTDCKWGSDRFGLFHSFFSIFAMNKFLDYYYQTQCGFIMSIYKDDYSVAIIQPDLEMRLAYMNPQRQYS